VAARLSVGELDIVLSAASSDIAFANPKSRTLT
jgi:hypothetical protein